MVESIITDVCGLRHYLGTDSSPQRGARVHRRSPSVRPPPPRSPALTCRPPVSADLRVLDISRRRGRVTGRLCARLLFLSPVRPFVSVYRWWARGPFPPVDAQASRLPAPSPTLVHVCLFSHGRPGGRAAESHLVCSSAMAGHVEHLFLCSLAT